MKKFILALSVLFVLVGCGNLSNTPTKRVETFFKKYQTLDNDVLSDLDKVIAEEESFNTEQRSEYRDLMKKHYQNLIYEIKDEVINADEATVKVEITVTDFNKIFNETADYLIAHPEEFDDENGNYSSPLYVDYQLEQLRKATEKVKYTLEIPVLKSDKEWEIKDIDDITLKKINGIYSY